MLSRTIKTVLNRILYWHLMVIMALSIILILLTGLRSGLSALAGGLAYWLPTFIFIKRTSAHAGAKAARKFVMALMVGEGIKLILTAILFAVVARYLPVNLLSMFVGLVGAVFAYWIISIFMLYQKGESI